MNPHDAIFKENFSKLENAVDLINNVLPKEIRDGIDFKTLVLENDSYTDRKLKKYFSDLAYTCSYKDSRIKI
ncbi:MAG TPA: Rpn family recombination-promoting nuclease/putative transposase, partial [Spirochaetota bacterium]|nr:Rpn family recombination-promoting nuclease/putative transposase [Spirochaetota bacterium]